MRRASTSCGLILLAALSLSAAAGLAQQPVASPEPDSIAPAPAGELLRLPPVDWDPSLSASSDPGTERPSPTDKAKPPAAKPEPGLPGMGMGPAGAGPFRYSATWFPSTHVDGQNADWGLVGQDLQFMCPLRVDPPGMWLLTGSVRHRLIDTDAIMPTTGEAYPGELWNVNLGLMYHRKLANGWLAGGGVSLGSASDGPFGAVRDLNVSMNAMLRVPQGERNAWMYFLMYSPLGELDFPIPGVAFNWNPSEKFRANIGLPFQLTYRPDEHWVLEASYMLIHTIRAKATYRFGERMAVFGAYDWSSEVYSLADRVDDDERFYMYDQRLTLGLETALASFATLTVTAGYAFDRYSFTGTRWDTTGDNRVDIGDGPLATLQLGLRY